MMPEGTPPNVPPPAPPSIAPDVQRKGVYRGMEIVLGMVLLLVLHVLQIPLSFLAGWIACLDSPKGPQDYCVLAGAIPFFAIGLSQIVYVLPAVALALVFRRIPLLQGLLIGAAITFLLNAACWGMIVIPASLGGL